MEKSHGDAGDPLARLRIGTCQTQAQDAISERVDLESSRGKGRVESIRVTAGFRDRMKLLLEIAVDLCIACEGERGNAQSSPSRESTNTEGTGEGVGSGNGLHQTGLFEKESHWMGLAYLWRMRRPWRVSV